MKKNNEPMELSYYGLSLLSFLKESHPDKVNDTAFIEARANLAAETYENALREGYVQSGAEEMANEVLYNGLHFSCYDALKSAANLEMIQITLYPLLRSLLVVSYLFFFLIFTLLVTLPLSPVR